MAPPRMDEMPTAQSILTALLLTSTAFLIPTLPSLRLLLTTASPSLSSSTTDATLKLYLREITTDRKLARSEVEKRIRSYRLLRKDASSKKGKGKASVEDEEESDEDEGVEFDEVGLATALERLEEEARATQDRLDALQVALEGSRKNLDASVTALEAVARSKPRVAPSVRRGVEEKISSVEAGMEHLRAMNEIHLSQQLV